MQITHVLPFSGPPLEACQQFQQFCSVCQRWENAMLKIRVCDFREHVRNFYWRGILGSLWSRICWACGVLLMLKTSTSEGVLSLGPKHDNTRAFNQLACVDCDFADMREATKTLRWASSKPLSGQFCWKQLRCTISEGSSCDTTISFEWSCSAFIGLEHAHSASVW